MRPQRIEPGPGQESVWDYPRPPRVEPCARHLQIELDDGTLLADTRRSIRVLETSHPPVYYLPSEDIRMELLRPGVGQSFCEWKGQAHYYQLQSGKRAGRDVAWAYARPTKAFASLAGYLAFYASRVGRCLVDGEEVRSQPGDFYGGWITQDIVGPFKGEPGSWGW